MKNLYLPCTEKNLLDTFKKDTVGRNHFLRHFIEALNHLDECTIIALDSQWGSGKTFFVKQVKYILDATNPFLKATDLPRPQILEDFERFWKADELRWIRQRARVVRDTDLEQEQVDISHFCIYYDAWKHDTEGDPLLSLVYDIYAHMKMDYSFSEIKTPKETFKDFMSVSFPFFNQGGISLSPLPLLCDWVVRDKPFEEIQAAINMEQKIHDFLDTILPEKGNRLVIFIDELDRCNPTFAVRLLEKIKHYFNHEDITFVLSIDANELEATIKHYYGSEFNAHLYLDKFLDYRFSLPKVKTSNYLSLVDEKIGRLPVVRFLVDEYCFQMRQITRYVQLLKVALPSRYYENEFDMDKTTSFIYRVIVPFLIALKIYDQASYNRFVNGNDYSPLKIFDTEKGNLFIHGCLYTGTEVAVSIDKSLQKFYSALFQGSHQGASGVVGELTILGTHRENVDEIISFVSDFSEYVD